MKHLMGTGPELYPTYLSQYYFRRRIANKRVFENILEIRRTYIVCIMHCTFFCKKFRNGCIKVLWMRKSDWMHKFLDAVFGCIK